ncbi:MAG: helix-turn-helix domain-containing protein [Acidithiobacillus sp.]|nr:helix-turn-helix domain-containing protein [Acidithiobacillus sp.]
MVAHISPRKRTLDLQEAADFLQISKEELRRRAKKGLVPGAAKPGRRWAFLEDSLVAYFHSFYPEKSSIGSQEDIQCSENEGKYGGLISLPQTGSALEDRLKHRTRRRHRNFTTNSKPIYGDKYN